MEIKEQTTQIDQNVESAAIFGIQKKWVMFIVAGLGIILILAMLLFYLSLKDESPDSLGKKGNALLNKNENTQSELKSESKTGQDSGGGKNTTKVVRTFVKNPSGIVVAPEGFPNDLLIEPLVVPTVNESFTDSENNLLVAKRQYTSSMHLQEAYGISQVYLKEKKGWNIIIDSGSESKTNRFFTAIKDGYEAKFDFIADSNGVVKVTVTVSSHK